MKTIIFSFLFTLAFPFVVSGKTLTEIVPIQHAEGMKTISLKGVILKGSKWDKKIIKLELAKVNMIFSQCEIQIKDIRLMNSTIAPAFSSVVDVTKAALSFEKNKLKKRKEVVLVFASTITGKLREEGGEKTGGFSFNHASQEYASKEEMSLENLIVLLDIAHTEGYKILRNSEYSPIAHEMGHVYLNEGHVNEANLMASSINLVNAELTSEQCEYFRNSDLIK
jgi:hypothetical protein